MTLHESYVCSRVSAETITIATLTYMSAMIYSAIMTSAMCKKYDPEQCGIIWLNV